MNMWGVMSDISYSSSKGNTKKEGNIKENKIEEKKRNALWESPKLR
jgi:hypothetical protein